ncbi:hypothetical protein BGW36DRAFT_308039 [Talaromyces proteolyticus]|uniref:DUF2423 domain-containing protein n=1 Tax=Talaromyces proteolyticus TaxID=1131652 RepID=A0AAD4KE37_9EURO|nr:uncharacterized protein BGW36DRAFT_308039 [Talaromyces proteolyticus]KAH8689707.1 hypothetical protein BGW36DRAFT_308039 [Talaromyces proteolyticus]
MAKSVRSSTRKRNSAKLRSTIFGPAADARTARLSAKLQELAAKPLPVDPSSISSGDKIQEDEGLPEDVGSKMAIDDEANDKPKSSKKHLNRVKKHTKKPRNSIAFSKPRRNKKN